MPTTRSSSRKRDDAADLLERGGELDVSGIVDPPLEGGEDVVLGRAAHGEDERECRSARDSRR